MIHTLMESKNTHTNELPPHPFLALGTWAMGGEAPWGYGPCPEDTAHEAITEALALGCRHFDTAALFGDGAVERLLGSLLPPDAQITTRVGCRLENDHPVADFSPDHLLKQVADSAKRLGRTKIDRVLLHTPSPGALRDRHAMDALISLRESGMVAAVGASVFEPDEAALAIDRGADWVCIPYNPINRKAETSLFSAARAAGCKVQVREVLHNGRLTDHPRNMATVSQFDVRREWPEFLYQRLQMAADTIRQTVPEQTVVSTCIGYALSHPQVDAVVVGCRTPKQVRAAFSKTLPLDQEQRQRLENALYGRVSG
jgi:aryl-alcohol dehydrogenase-like predicted oxidoreductase